MAVTRSTAGERAAWRGTRAGEGKRASRGIELLALVLASTACGLGLYLTWRAKAEAYPRSVDAMVNLTRLDRAEQLLPPLAVLASPADRQFAARRIYDFIKDRGDALPNVGALAHASATVREIRGTPRLEEYRRRLDEYRQRHPDQAEPHIPLLTPGELSAFKTQVIVRTPADFERSLWIWVAVLAATFYALHVFWRVTSFDGDPMVLPVLHLLSGAGLIVMLSLRDPLRDLAMAEAFARGVAAGVAALGIASTIDYQRLLGRLSYVPLLGSFLLSAALVVFGSGPGASDARVNLGPFQPVETIKILLVLFLAGYFANRWELLRELKERRPALARLARGIELPRLEYLAPVLVGVAVALLFFYLQKDLGPALVIACVFLVMYAVARNRVGLPALGLALLAAGLLTGYFLGIPHTVRERVDMWLSPWDNHVRGGEQVVHALWALASGGAAGMGLGLGQPDSMPAAHTDLVLASLGEEWGFGGLLAVYAMYALLVSFGIRAARRAATDYAFFLALGLTLLVSGETLLISAGILGLLPLSGVVAPFLSYGGSAMLANFAIFGMLLAVSRRGGDASRTAPFHSSVRALSIALGVMGAAVVLRATWIEVARPDLYVGAGTLTVQADGVRRYQYNPRLMAIARSIPRGTIYDRNGLPIATSDWNLLEQHRDAYKQMAVSLEECCRRTDTRYYPLGAAGFHLLGDLRTRANWAAANSSLEERDSNTRLQGYDDRARVVEVRDDPKHSTFTFRYDYRELVPLLRHRHDPDDPAVRRILELPRDVHMSIDARLQLKVENILAARLKQLKRDAGAAVVLDPLTGDLLASASIPLAETGNEEGWLDRARYGLYPPGSTFKVVTAAAALRKDPASERQTYECLRLPDGRVGNTVKGWSRPIRDDIADKAPHGTVNMERGLIVSCNAYFAQLAAGRVGADALLETAKLFGISVANPATAAKLRDALPQAGYGQGQVVASPFQMARVAATVAGGGRMPYGRWIVDETNPRVSEPQTILAPDVAATLARFMRGVVTSGTGRSVAGAKAPIAGKTGTAELAGAPSHAWFIGYAPYQGVRKIAFAVIIEHGQYGGSAAAPAALEIVNAASQMGLLEAAPAAATRPEKQPGETSQ